MKGHNIKQIILAFLPSYSELRKFTGLGITAEQAHLSKFGLAKEVLAEVPNQLCEFMRSRPVRA